MVPHLRQSQLHRHLHILWGLKLHKLRLPIRGIHMKSDLQGLLTLENATTLEDTIDVYIDLLQASQKICDLSQNMYACLACMFWVEMMLYIFPGSPMKLKERPANPYMTGSELPPAQLLIPPAPHDAPPDTCIVAMLFTKYCAQAVSVLAYGGFWYRTKV